MTTGGSVSGVHHVGIVVERLERAFAFWRDTLGLPLLREAEIPDQGVRAALLAAGESEVELLEPTRSASGVARFLARRGEGLHHLCLATPDVDGAVAGLAERQVELLDRVPRAGLAGRIAFLHPRACHGVLVELATPPAEAARPDSPVRLKRLVAGCVDPRGATRTYQDLFGLPEVAINGGGRRMLGWAGGMTLLLVPADEAGGLEGLVALSMVAPDLDALGARLQAGRAAVLRGAGEITVEPASASGVHLHLSRYHFP
jgi:methylmalonyl-CoA/ethylmalonyl-CoA epimerase